MSNENQPCTWAEMETRLLASGAQLMDVAMQAAQARAASDGGSKVIADLLGSSDLAPIMSVTGSNMACDRITLEIWLCNQRSGKLVARLFEITADGEMQPCLH